MQDVYNVVFRGYIYEGRACRFETRNSANSITGFGMLIVRYFDRATTRVYRRKLSLKTETASPFGMHF